MYVVHMATFTSETVTTVTRRYLLPLPSTSFGLDALWTDVLAAWRNDHPGQRLTDDAVAITAKDDVLVFSWAVPGTDAVSNDEHMARAWSQGYGARAAQKAASDNPFRKDEPAAVHAECGHAWSEHTGLGCMVRPPGGSGFCPCMTSGVQG